MRAICGVKLMDKTTIEELMDLLGLNERLDKMAKANGVQWYGYVLKRDDDDNDDDDDDDDDDEMMMMMMMTIYNLKWAIKIIKILLKSGYYSK